MVPLQSIAFLTLLFMTVEADADRDKALAAIRAVGARPKPTRKQQGA